MRYWIAIAVVAAHVVLLVLLFGRWQTPRPASTSAAGGGESSHGAGAGPVPATDPASASAGGGTPGPAGAAAPAGSAPERFSPEFFRRAARELPPKLQNATERCRTGVVVDWTARSLLWGKNETRPVPIASLTKMMTVLLVVEQITAQRDLDWATPVQVTREAALIGGRQVWLDPRETFPVQDLVRAMLIHSANDAAFLLAQRLDGSEAQFVRRMQERAAALGLTSFEFHNSHGLPDGPTQRENLGSAIELAFLAGRLLGFPKVVEWSSTRMSYLEPRIDGKRTQLVNTNHLVGRVPGVNGMKTGFTDKSGYCLAATCEREGRQVIVIVTGCARGTERDQLAADLIEWAFSAP